MRKKVIVVSDVHLGYDHSNRTEFEAFLSSLVPRDDVEQHLVLLGDIVDMWRRDMSGAFLECHSTFDRLFALQGKGFQVHFIAGNHDCHLLYLNRDVYRFNFLPSLVLEDPPYTYMFKHGHEFDHQQNQYINEMLCRLMSDEVAQVQDGVWGRYNALKFHLTSWLMLGPRRTRISELKVTPELRLSNERLRDIESTAFAEVRGKWNTILVFGHTHSPFINELGNLANAGSWVTEPENAYFNTYVELFEGQARLFHYGKEEIRVRKAVR